MSFKFFKIMEKIKYLTYKILFNLTNSEKLFCNPILHVQKNIKKYFHLYNPLNRILSAMTF